MTIFEICTVVATLVFLVIGVFIVKFIFDLTKVTNSTNVLIDNVNNSTITHLNGTLKNVMSLTDNIENNTLNQINQSLKDVNEVTYLTKEKIEMLADIIDKLSVIGDALDQVKNVLSIVKNFKFK